MWENEFETSKLSTALSQEGHEVKVKLDFQTFILKLLKGTRDNSKIHVNIMKLTFLCRLRQDETYDET